MKYKTIGVGLGRSERNDINKNFEDIDEDIKGAKKVVTDLIDGNFDDAALNTEIEQRLNNLETEYAPKLTQVTQQLAETAKQTDLDVVNSELLRKANQSEVRKDTATQPINVLEMDTETKALFTGGAVAVVGENSVGRENLKIKAVEPENTTFLERTANIFGSYQNREMSTVNNKLFIKQEDTSSVSIMTIVKVEPDTRYSVRIPAEDAHLMDNLLIGTDAKLPAIEDFDGNGRYSLETTVSYNWKSPDYTFVTNSSAQYMFVKVSSVGLKPRLQIVKGLHVPYEPPFVLPTQYTPKIDELRKQMLGLEGDIITPMYTDGVITGITNKDGGSALTYNVDGTLNKIVDTIKGEKVETVLTYNAEGIVSKVTKNYLGGATV